MRYPTMLVIALALSTFGFAQAAPQGNTPNSQQQPSPATTQPGHVANGTTGVAPQVSAANPVAGQTTVEGCLQESWGRFIIRQSSGSTTYNVKGSGLNLSRYVNHVVRVKGIADPQGATGNMVPLYNQNIQDTGNTCGAAQTVAGAVPVTGETGNQGAAMNTTTTAQPGVTPGAQTPTAMQQNQAGQGVGASGAATAQQGAITQPTPSGTQQPQPQGATGTTTTPPQQSGTAGTAATPQQGGSTGTTTTPQQPSGAATPQQSAGSENKGTPGAGTPTQGPSASAGSIGAPESSGAATSGAATSSSGEHPANEYTMKGCLTGQANRFSLDFNGKTYRLHGKTSQMAGLSGHQVEVSGEITSGNAIRVSQLRDLGSSCSK